MSTTCGCGVESKILGSERYIDDGMIRRRYWTICEAALLFSCAYEIMKMVWDA